MPTPTPPRCKCGNPCQYYGFKGGYSKACFDCNVRNAARQREARARKRMSDIILSFSPSVEVTILRKNGTRETKELGPGAVVPLAAGDQVIEAKYSGPQPEASFSIGEAAP